MIKCPHCNLQEHQVKNGLTPSGSQQYKCKPCNRKYTPVPKSNGYDKATKQSAIRLVLDGSSQRQSARHMGVSHGSVANWLKAHSDSLPEDPEKPETPVEVAEQDELVTFVGEKKTKSLL